MTGGEVKIDGIFPGIGDDFANPALDTQGIVNTYGEGYQPQITILCDCNNVGIVYLSEITGAAPDQQIPMFAANAMTFDYNAKVRVMNEFYVVGDAGDLLTVICR